MCSFSCVKCNYIRDAIEGSTVDKHEMVMNVDAITVIDDITEKYYIYMRHIARCKCQNISIAAIFSPHQTTYKESNGKVTKDFVIMDYKMGFEAQSLRE